MLKTIEIIKKYNFNAKKNLGQHFLLNDDLLDKIVACAGAVANSEVLEVGPGPGGLTTAILRKNPKRLVTVELDQRSVEAINSEIKPFFSNLEIIGSDALLIDENDIFDKKFKIIANLPYNIGTTLLLKWLENCIEKVETITLLLQKEVVDRIIATPKTREYGRLSVICQYLCQIKKYFDIPPGAFCPPPKVISSVVGLIPKQNIDLNITSRLIWLTNILFSKKRKTIFNNLRVVTDKSNDILNRCGINLKSRSEELCVGDFLKILEYL
ncbi:ribosomal RNA small subunit methyltransferase A [Bacilli bacterium]|nr:ribosomal RNA small subunit methyltransferase A [Bacilli bacterium]